jgi:hypothetical protein
MNKSESIKNLAKALSDFQAEIENPKNTASNPFFHSKYAPLQEILNLVRPKLAQHGLAILQSPSGDGKNITINTILMHESGEWIEGEPLVLQADKPTAQSAGSAITYGRRYAISAVLGISSEDDDDGNSASGNGKERTTEIVTDEMVKEIFNLAKLKGISPKGIKETILKQFKKPEVKNLTEIEYNKLKKNLEKLPDKQGGQQA